MNQAQSLNFRAEEAEEGNQKNIDSDLLNACDKEVFMSEPIPILALIKDVIIAQVGIRSLTVRYLAHETGMREKNFRKQFLLECGVPPTRWLWVFRILFAGRLIELYPWIQLTNIGRYCGFRSLAHFSRSFKVLMGLAPKEYRKVCQKKLRGHQAIFSQFQVETIDKDHIVQQVMLDALQLA